MHPPKRKTSNKSKLLQLKRWRSSWDSKWLLRNGVHYTIIIDKELILQDVRIGRIRELNKKHLISQIKNLRIPGRESWPLSIAWIALTTELWIHRVRSISLIRSLNASSLFFFFFRLAYEKVMMKMMITPILFTIDLRFLMITSIWAWLRTT